MSIQLDDGMTVTFNRDLSMLPVSAQEVQLVRAHLGDILLKVLMQTEEE